MIRDQARLILFAATHIVAAALLFAIQPMAARAVLPILGGSAAVWTTCAAFFQAALLAGYAYAYGAASYLGHRAQNVLHALLLLLAIPFLPPTLTVELAPSPSVPPVLWLLAHLTMTLGLPLVVVASTAPLLQHWYAGRPDSLRREPYVLYAASNLGSLGALLAYPFLIEPAMSLASQSRAWSAAFLVLIGLVLACVVLSPRPAAIDRPGHGPASCRGLGYAPLLWIALAAIPSSLLLAVTAYLSTDLAAMPLLWIVPLALYLLSFVIVFARPGATAPRAPARALPYLVMTLAPALAAGLVQLYWLPLHLAVLFFACLVCNGELAARRPPPEALTAFYLCLAIGGVLGGLFNALLAPVLFQRLAEYPLMIVLALALPAWLTAPPPRFGRRDALLLAALLGLGAILTTNVADVTDTGLGVLLLMLACGLGAWIAWTHRSKPVRFALGVGAIWLACGLGPGTEGRILRRQRTFYGTLRVTEDATDQVRRLFLGSTMHGLQSLDPAQSREPQAYFSRSGPIGDVFANLRSHPHGSRIGVVGLGVGTLAAYAEPDQDWWFYELDPAIIAIARDDRLFTYLSRSRARSTTIVPGDARLALRKTTAPAFDLLVLDAFTSDAVPTHLLTREALALYRSRLAPDGLIAFNLSNRYLNLAPIIAALARDAGMACRVRVVLGLGMAEKRAGRESIWAVVGPDDDRLGPLANDPRWVRPRPAPLPWTDDHADLVSALTLHPGRVQTLP